MATELQFPAWPPYPVEPWPPDDTEESILGTDLHQTTIRNLVLGINGAARLSRAPGQSPPWRALTQVLLLGCKRPDGSYVRTYPDVFVYRQTIDPNRGSHTIEADGPPVLVVEVLSEPTYEADIDLVRGKGYSYARAGVPEYLALDPTRQYVPGGVRAWRLVEGVYQTWEPRTGGRYQSEQLPISIALTGAMAEVYLSDGRRMHLEDEIEEEIERLRRLLENGQR